MKLNQELIRKGFRIENGTLEKYTIEGRKRKNWKSTLRGKSQQFIKEKCEECGRDYDLTIHHKIYLSKNGGASEDNCQTLCRVCHDKVHEMVPKQKVKRIKSPRKKKKLEEKKVKEDLILEKDEWGSYRIGAKGCKYILMVQDYEFKPSLIVVPKFLN